MRKGARPMLITGKMMWTMVVIANWRRLAITGSNMSVCAYLSRGVYRVPG
jgi:hypothetical protein